MAHLSKWTSSFSFGQRLDRNRFYKTVRFTIVLVRVVVVLELRIGGGVIREGCGAKL